MAGTSGTDETLPGAAASTSPGTDETLAASSARSSPATDQTLAASSEHAITQRPRTPSDQPETLAASDASLAPVSSRGRRASINPDYEDLVQVDPQHYSLQGELARGGMGRILQARDRRLGRGVAIKQLLDRDANAVARFEREVKITARLQHPSIVHVHEAGRWPTGEPFYSMKLIEGLPLDKAIAKAATLQARLALLPNVIAVVDALAYAHGQGVIHRDLKPGNVLVGEFGETVVIDWGLAKDLRAGDNIADSLRIGPFRATADDGATVDGSVIGTPAYMPPEQARGERVDERADVYSLGALLYHLLAGAPPYEAATPSQILARVLEGPPKPLAVRDAEIPVELIAIVDKAMSRDANARFPTAKEMVGELKRFTMGQLVASHRYTRWQLVQRWIRRNRAAVAVGGIAFATLAVLATIGVAKILAERDRANAEARVALDRLDDATIERARQEVVTDPTSALARLRLLSPHSRLWSQARMIAADARGRGVAERVLHDGGAPFFLDFAPDATRLGAFEKNGRLRIWDTKTWKHHFLQLDHDNALAFELLADRAMWITDTGEVYSWDFAATKPTLVASNPAPDQWGYRAAAIAPDGTHYALWDRGTTGFLVDLAKPAERRPLVSMWGEFVEDGRALVTVIRSSKPKIERVDVATGAITELAAESILAFAVDRDHLWVSKNVDIKDENGRPGWRYVLEDLTGNFTHVSPPGAPHLLSMLPGGELASATSGNISRDDTVTVTLPSIHSQIRLLGHAANIQSIATASDGRIASGDGEGTIRIWRVPNVERTRPAPPPDSARKGCSMGIPLSRYVTTVQAAWRRGDELVVVKKGPSIEVRDLANRRTRQIAVTDFPPELAPQTVYSCQIVTVGQNRFVEAFEGEGQSVAQVARARDGRHVATLGKDTGHVVVWDLATNRGRLLGVHKEADAIVIAPDGAEIITKARERGAGVFRWNTQTGERTPFEAVTSLDAIAYSPDGTLVGGADLDKMFVMPAKGPMKLGQSMHVTGPIETVVFSPDGKRLAGVSTSIQIELWEINSPKITSLRGHTTQLERIEFLPDGRLLSTAGDHVVRVWKPDGTNTVLAGHEGSVTSFELLDGDRLLTSSTDGTSRIWDLATGTSRLLGGHMMPVKLAYRVESAIVTLDELDQTLRHADDLPVDEAGLRRWIDNATTLRITK